LVQRFLDGWRNYETGVSTFYDFFQSIDFRNLIFHNSIGVIKATAKERPAEFESLLLELYDESNNLKERIKSYITKSQNLYFSLPSHGKNTFQDERTIATLLTFRYPDKYTLFKDSFYNKLCKGLGVKPAQTGEKILHYYSLVKDFMESHLINHPDIIVDKIKLFDTSCYPDQTNLLLAQDILYTTLDSNDEVEIYSDEDIAEIPKTKKNKNVMNSLNQILFGPPGTGKTYHTINRAVAIANPEFKIETSNRNDLKVEYDRLVKEGQIEFVTFHQNMSYEDFIEGIKPMEPKEADSFLKYEIKDGIFKRLVERASKVPQSSPVKFSLQDDDFEKAGFYKLSLGDTSNPDDDQIYEWCIKNGYIGLGWGDAINFTGLSELEVQQMVPQQLEKFAARSVNYFIHYIKPGDYVVVTYGNLQFRAIGKVTGEYEFRNVEGLNIHQFRKIEWLLNDVELPFEEVYNKQFSQQSIYRLNKREIKKEFFVKAAVGGPVDHKLKNYVLIIDEINRGNISQIFGELITLIEEDKRASKKEALSVVLPYSKKAFTVPSNLYIVGTMNTADRSVEALDTALRRRFIFEEMMPQTELLHPKNIICNFFNENVAVLWKEWISEPYLSKKLPLYSLLGINPEFDDKAHEGLWDEGKEYWSVDDLDFVDDKKFTGIRLDELLNTINKRIEKLLSRDNCIGHSYFLSVRSIDDLMDCFKNKIIPLLQEYFYGDYAKMCLVIGKGFVNIDVVKSGNETNYFADVDHDALDNFLEKKVWAIKQIDDKEEFLTAISILLNK
jgi:hypothetical protein